MNIKKVFGFCLVLLGSFFTSACFTIEKEIFLNADGSGEMVLHISMPDLPDSSKAGAAAAPKDPFAEIEKFKKDIMTQLPSTVKLKEAKQVKQNGVLNFFAIIEFKDLKDTEKLLATFGQSELDKASGKDEFQWSSTVEKQAGKSTFIERFYFDTSQMTEAKAGASAEVKTTPAPKSSPASRNRRGATGSKATGKPPEVSASADVKIEGMEQLEALMLSLIRLRFVLHAPAPITESNADLVLNKRIAVWNCSLLNFSKDKKPIELKATY